MRFDLWSWLQAAIQSIKSFASAFADCFWHGRYAGTKDESGFELMTFRNTEQAEHGSSLIIGANDWFQSPFFVAMDRMPNSLDPVGNVQIPKNSLEAMRNPHDAIGVVNESVPSSEVRTLASAGGGRCLSCLGTSRQQEARHETCLGDIRRSRPAQCHVHAEVGR